MNYYNPFVAAWPQGLAFQSNALLNGFNDGSKDIPGLNDVGAVKKDEVLLASDEVLFHGHMVAVVVGESYEACRSAAAKVEVEYAPLPAMRPPSNPSNPSSPANDRYSSAPRHDGRHGSGVGWIGLIGLVGLLGLRREHASDTSDGIGRPI